MQVPAWQTSPIVQRFPSLQLGLPEKGAGIEQSPVAGLQVPPGRQASPGHATCEPALHAPDWQVSAWVQALPSSQAVPLLFGTGAGHPVAGTQAPMV